ncbi:MAG TPA: NAD-dependent epimerase/dehydratase family protein [Solirubrobacterales bacterium]|nr:NAD-dependent epimerase/dehydratase family protein [Solirubrobacterales bacterium]
MSATKRIVIAGVSTRWGSELARTLQRRPGVGEIIGIDSAPPTSDLGRTEFVEADIRNPVISRILPSLEPDVVVHCGIVWYPEKGRPSRALHDINVIGTLLLLAACEKTSGLQALIARGSAAIYGSAPGAPAFFTEDMARRLPLVTRFQRDIGELEGYFDNFARRRPEITCCMLRFGVEVGPGLDTPFNRYLNLPVVPTRMGFDPRLQLLHVDDATGALAAATLNPVRGAVNVAPDGAISLSRLLRLCGKSAVGVPPVLVGVINRRIGNYLGSADLYRDGELLLRYGRGCDNRRLREEVGFELAFDSEGTARDFARTSQGIQALFPSPHPGSPVRSVSR